MLPREIGSTERRDQVEQDFSCLTVTAAIEECIVCVQGEALLLPRLSAASCRHEDQTISSPFAGAVRFEPLGPTPLPDSRCTFQVFQRPFDCLWTVLKKAQRPVTVVTEQTSDPAGSVAVVHHEFSLMVILHSEPLA